ncbi:MAG: hypothetical protein GC179_19045 [Anaerolineaceae bacterium]|nr:hypothetical protein [Anaerolineaceae bacterium]
MRRVHAGVSRKAEWVAPDDVVQLVSTDYLRALDWLADAALGKDIHFAPRYLTGRFLTRFQTIINYQSAPNHLHFIGIMTARHHVQVRQFSEDGSRCLVVDCQTEQRIESRQLNDNGWFLLQDMGDAALVFQMCYDPISNHWKIESFVQELPTGWGNRADLAPLQLLSNLPTTIGRDN